jgi:hypothetical protein
MLGTAFDSGRLISVTVHVGDALTEAEVVEILSVIERQARAIAAHPEALPVSLIIVETDRAPDARQRRRIGEAGRAITRGAQVLVTSSSLVRMVMTAIRWFSPANRDYPQTTCSTYEQARAWLVKHTAHSGEVYDALVKQARDSMPAVGHRARAGK